jgi:vancomycin resistance protein YoaR
MSTITNTNEKSVLWPASNDSRPVGRKRRSTDRLRLWTYLSIASMAIPAAALLFVGVVAGLPANTGEIETGVRIGGYQVGTAGWSQTEAELQASMQSYLDAPVALRLGDRQQEVAPSALGIAFDMDATFERALDVGRGGVVEGARERFIARTSGVDIQPVVTYDANRFLDVLTTISAGVVTPPVNAVFTFEDGRVGIVPSSEGVGIHSGEAALLLKEAAGTFDHGPIDVPTVAIAPDVSTTDLQAVISDANRLAGQPIRLYDQGVVWELTPAELVPLLRYANNSVTLNMAAIEHRIGTLAGSINQPARNASVQHSGDGTFHIANGASERTLDLPATMVALESELRKNQHDVVLVVNEKSPTLSAERLQPLHQEISDIMTRGMLITWPDGEQWLNPVEYAGTFEFNEIEGTISVNREHMAALVQPIADGASRPATGLRWRGGQLITTENSDPGRAIDVPATVSNAIDGALNGNPVVPLVVSANVDPLQNAANIVIPDLLATSTTYYGSSGTNRRINVEVGAAAVDGVLVPPRGTFSFNDAIGGSATLDDGYQMGYGIITGADGVPRTVPSVAGGICLVSTSVFQASFWAGMEITNRNWHLYWIPDYGEGLGGLQGLDATVDTDWGLDFNFVNPTDQWLAIRSFTDGQYHTVEIWGTNQGWTVEVADPVITNVVAADKDTIHREESPDVAPGQEIHVETARDGFSAAIHRVVKDRDGKVISDRTFNSYYQPSRNVVLVAQGEGATASSD